VSWRDQLLPASFRGVGFFVESTELVAGRRAVHHEIPFSEEPPFSEDLGARTHTFPIEGYVIGADYFAARDALLTALNTAGPGELVHPYHGTKRVQVGNVRVRHEAREGGIARFTIELTETSAPLTLPTAVVDAPAQLVTSAAAVKTSASAEFLAKFDEVSNLRDAVTGAITAATDAVSSVLDRVALAGQTVAEITSQIETLTSTVGDLLDEPADFVDTMVALVEAVAAGLITAGAPISTLLELYSVDFGVRPPDDTPARLVEQVNFDATANLVKRLVLAEASAAAIEQTFSTYDDAVLARVSITDLIDSHTDDTADDVFPALQDMRRDLVQAVPGESSDLPRLVTFTPGATLPSLVLAHQLYGNLDREEDLVRRNRISNPSFVKGGVELQVLSDD